MAAILVGIIRQNLIAPISPWYGVIDLTKAFLFLSDTFPFTVFHVAESSLFYEPNLLHLFLFTAFYYTTKGVELLSEMLIKIMFLKVVSIQISQAIGRSPV